MAHTRPRLSVAIDAEIIQEILYRYGALREPDLAVVMAESLHDLVPTLLPVTAADAALAVQLFAQYSAAGIKPRDVIHVAVMQNNGLTHIISIDKHFDHIAGITRHDPHDFAATLPPHTPT